MSHWTSGSRISTIPAHRSPMSSGERLVARVSGREAYFYYYYYFSFTSGMLHAARRNV